MRACCTPKSNISPCVENTKSSSTGISTWTAVSNKRNVETLKENSGQPRGTELPTRHVMNRALKGSHPAGGGGGGAGAGAVLLLVEALEPLELLPPDLRRFRFLLSENRIDLRYRAQK